MTLSSTGSLRKELESTRAISFKTGHKVIIREIITEEITPMVFLNVRQTYSTLVTSLRVDIHRTNMVKNMLNCILISYYNVLFSNNSQQLCLSFERNCLGFIKNARRLDLNMIKKLKVLNQSIIMLVIWKMKPFLLLPSSETQIYSVFYLVLLLHKNAPRCRPAFDFRWPPTVLESLG